MLNTRKIGIINYGLGNIASVYNACLCIGLDVIVCNSPKDINLCSHLILPGVGTFSAGMNLLKSGNWVTPLHEFVNSSKPLLGICLGMQMLLESGTEVVPTQGLGFIQGSVDLMPKKKGFKIPHIGWNSIEVQNDHKILKGIRNFVDFYFVHSYICCPVSKSDIISITQHSSTFPSIICKNRVLGVQFHPEKSQPSGLKLLKNFAKSI